MPPLVDIKFDKIKLKKIERMFKDTPKAMPKIMVRSINKTATSTRVHTVDIINKKSKVGKAVIKKGILLTKATKSKFNATLFFSNRWLRIIQLSANKTKAGITHISPKSGSRVLLRHAFKAIMPTGHKGVFKRIIKGTTRIDYDGRLPIEEQISFVSVADLFQKGGTATRVERRAAKTLEKFIDQQVKLILEKR